MKDHKTGYYVWYHATRTWHRTYESAVKRALRVQGWGGDGVIQDCQTGMKTMPE